MGERFEDCDGKVREELEENERDAGELGV